MDVIPFQIDGKDLIEGLGKGLRGRTGECRGAGGMTVPIQPQTRG